MVVSIEQTNFVGYVRASTEKQATDGRSSLETPEARIRAAVPAPGGLLVKPFCDVDSGKRNDRPGYQKMLKYVLDDPGAVVLVQYLDRFGRRPKKSTPISGHSVIKESRSRLPTKKSEMMN